MAAAVWSHQKGQLTLKHSGFLLTALLAESLKGPLYVSCRNFWGKLTAIFRELDSNSVASRQQQVPFLPVHLLAWLYFTVEEKHLLFRLTGKKGDFTACWKTRFQHSRLLWNFRAGDVTSPAAAETTALAPKSISPELRRPGHDSTGGNLIWQLDAEFEETGATSSSMQLHVRTESLSHHRKKSEPVCFLFILNLCVLKQQLELQVDVFQNKHTNHWHIWRCSFWKLRFHLKKVHYYY